MIKDKKISEDFVKNAIIKWLSSKKWGHFEFGELHTQGVDIKCKKQGYGRYLFIECKGKGKIRQIDENNFVYSLGQIVTRMKSGGSTRNYYALGLPECSAKIAIRRIPWQVAKKLLLYVFSVNDNGKIIQYSWKEIKNKQGLVCKTKRLLKF